MEQPDVSVAILSYYHENYIEQSIDSVLSQKTHYSYEIVVSDDCSKDRTVAILKEYQKKYPDIIRIIVNTKNLGITQNFYQSRCSCRGRYIASLSGDDYWIDDTKIEKQVTYLDMHPEIYAVTTSIEGRFDNDIKPFKTFPLPKYRDRIITKELFLSGAQIGTHGMMIRNDYLSSEGRKYFSLIWKCSSSNDDAIESILVFNKGPVFSMDIKAAAYRVPRIKSGKHNHCSNNTVMRNFESTIIAYNNFLNEFPESINLFNLYKENVATGLAGAIRFWAFDSFRKVYKSIPINYRKRGLLMRAIPSSFRIAISTIIRKTKLKFS